MIILGGPQLEDGYTRIANEILEVVSKVKLNGTQYKILMVIWRYTYGFNRKDSEFSLNFLSEATNSNKQQVKRELDKLIEHKVITVVKEAGFNTSRRLSFNKKYSEWNIEGVQYIKKDTVSGLADSRVSKKEYPTVSGLEYQERKYKDITTTVIIEDEKVETEKKEESPVADTDADSVQQDKENVDLQRIENYYKHEVRKKTTCSGKDAGYIAFVYNKYNKDAEFIISVMDKGKQDYIDRYGKLEINSFNYFFSILEEKWEALHAKKEDVKVNKPIKKSYSGKKSQAIKTRFHNFEQRSDKYSAEQLEDVAARKRREYSERNKENAAL